MINRLVLISAAAGFLSLCNANADTFSVGTNAAITLPASGNANPFPSTIAVDSYLAPGIVKSTSVKLLGVTDSYPTDLTVRQILNPASDTTGVVLHQSSPRSAGLAAKTGSYDLSFLDGGAGWGAGAQPPSGDIAPVSSINDYVRSRSSSEAKAIGAPYASGQYALQITGDNPNGLAGSVKGWTLTFDTINQLHWDADAGVSDAVGGSGVWRGFSASDVAAGGAGVTAAKLWRTDTTTGGLINWMNEYNFTAHFGGADTGAKTVTVDAGGVTASSLVFESNGYTITGGTVTLQGTRTLSVAPDKNGNLVLTDRWNAAELNVTQDKSAVINSNLATTTPSVGIAKTGKGALTLNGAVNAGYFVVNDGALTLSATGTVNDNGLVVNGGTYTIAGAHTTSGSAVVNGGTLRVAGNSLLSADNLSVAGALVLDAGGTIALAPGSGTFIVEGTASIAAGSNLSAASVTIQKAGVLSLAAGAAMPAGASVTVKDSGTLRGTGNVAISGGLTVAGASASTVIAGNLATSGATSLSAGTLGAGGDLYATDLTVTGGNLNVTGNLNLSGAFNMSGGTYSPGRIGTVRAVSVSAPVTFSGSSHYIADLASDSSYDTLAVTGAAALGGKLTMNVTGMVSAGQTFHLVTATGGVTGAFDSITSTGNAPFIAYRAAATAGDYESFVSFANSSVQSFVSPNQWAVASTIARVQTGSSDPVLTAQLDAFAGAVVTRSDAITFLNQFLPTNMMAANQMSRRDIGTVTQAFNTFTSGIRTQSAARSFAWDRPFDGSGFYFADDAPVLLASNDPEFLPRKAPAEDHNFTVWGNGSYAFDKAKADTKTGALARDDQSYGASLGADYRVSDAGDVHLGVFGSFSASAAKVSDPNAPSKAESESVTPGAYATWDVLGLDWDLMAGYAMTSYDLKRTTSAGEAKAKPDGGTAIARFGISRALATDDRWFLTPMAGLTYAHTTIDSYTETGAGPFNLSVASQDIDSLTSNVGCSFGKELELGGVKLIPEGRVGWGHEFFQSGKSVAVSSALLGATNGYTVKTGNVASDFMTLGTGLSMRFSKTVSANLSYDGTFFQNNITAEHRFSAMVRVSF